MSRGKPFICWLSSPGHYRDVALHIGDEVEFRGENRQWRLVKIGKKRGCEGFSYVARSSRKEETIWMLTQLRPIKKVEAENGN